MKILRWALRALRAQRQLSLFFVFNLSLGLSGFLLLESFRESLKTSLEANSRKFLSADLSVSARRMLSESEIQSVREVFGRSLQGESHLIELFSMVSSKRGARLVQIKAVDEQYPFYGDLKLSSGRVVDSIQKQGGDLLEQNVVWAYPELLIQLNLKVGDQIKIGETQFHIAEEVLDDSTQTFKLSGLAPKLYMSRKHLQQTQLLQKGSTMWDSLLIKAESLSSEDLKLRAKELFRKIPDPAVQVTTSKEAGEDSARVLISLSDYLGLVSLVALFLALIGTGYLFRNYFVRQLRTIAISQMLGMGFASSVALILIQVAILSFSAWSLALLISFLSFPFFQQMLEAVSALKVPFQMSPRLIWQSLLMAGVSSFSISGYFLLRLRLLKPQQLFQEQNSVQLQFSKSSLIYFIFPLLAFWGLSVMQARSFSMGSVFFGLLMASLLALIVFSVGVLRTLEFSFRKSNWMLKSISRQLSRKWAQSLAGVLALGIGSLLITVLPQVQQSIQAEVARPEGLKLPAIFLFDVQDEQLLKLSNLLNELGFQKPEFSPLIRARIVSVNEVPFEKRVDASQFQTREQESENRFRNRGFNLSYRENLSGSESLAEGKYWDSKFDPNQQKHPSISLEKKFAENLKIKINDILSFDIQGVSFEGKVTSFRDVKWNSFQPNFFVMFQPGVLEDAPKTWLVALPNIPSKSSAEVQSAISDQFSNVSSVDVSRAIEKILDITQKMSGSLQLMAILSFITGFFVLYSVISSQLQEAIQDLNLQKILGISNLRNLLLLLGQYGFLAFLASFSGGLLSFGVASVLMHQIFNTGTLFVWSALFQTTAMVVSLTLVLIVLVAWRVLRRKPNLDLNS